MNVPLRGRRVVAAGVGATALVFGVGGFVTSAFADPPGPPLGQSSLEAWSSCTATLCIDAPPDGPKGLDGSGGWGWDNATNGPVTSLQVGQPAGFTVTVLQPTGTPACGVGSGSVTLTYSSQDFSLNGTDSRGVAGAPTFARGGVEVYQYGGDFWCHTAQSVAYTFTPQNPTQEALVTATVAVNGQQASETFPVSITQARPGPQRH